MRHHLVVFACLLTVVAGCGKPTLKSLCTDSVQASCDKLFECAPSQASQLGFSSAADCKAKREMDANCAQYDTFTCDGTYLDTYQRCLDDLRALSCTAMTQPASCNGLGTPSCTSSDGKVVCSRVSDTASGSACTSGREGCGDGHTYEVACTGGSCECRVDGVVAKTFSGNSCPTSSSELNTACGWNLR